MTKPRMGLRRGRLWTPAKKAGRRLEKPISGTLVTFVLTPAILRVMATKIKADSAPIKAYHAALQAYAEHEAVHEGATETAFSNLLATTAKLHGWMLIPKKKKVVGKKVHIYPDGTLQDVFKLARGYWEAKDTNDDLDAEIQKKIAKKYPLTNTIFDVKHHFILEGCK